MPKIRRTSSGPRLHLSGEEVWLLGTVVENLTELLGDAGDGGADGVGREAGGEGVGGEAGADGVGGVLAGLDWATSPVERPDDPALRRLLPDAYPDDEQAAAEFRRYTDAALRDGMRADAATVSAKLGEVAGGGTITLDAEAGEAWLRVLTDARLVLASRLGIETATDHEQLDAMPPDDPRAGWFVLYSWLGMVLSGLLDAID